MGPQAKIPIGASIPLTPILFIYFSSVYLYRAQFPHIGSVPTHPNPNSTQK